MSMSPRRSGAKVAAIVGAGLLLALSAAPAAGQQDGTPDVLVSGGGILAQVDSQVAAVVPLAGGTSLPIKLGISGARLDAEVATASAAVVDFGLLGALGTLALVNSPTLKSVGVPTESFASFRLPGPVTADSRSQPEAEATPVFPKVPVGPLEARGGYERASAPAKGPARARTETGALALDLGVVKITAGGGVSETLAGAEEVRAVTSIGELRFDASGAAPVLRGIEWRLVQRMGQPAQTTFSIGSAEIGPTRFAFDSPSELAAGLDALNRALAPTGVSIVAPVATDGGLGPLTVQLRDSALAAQFVAPVYSQVLATGVNQLESTLVSGLPESGLAITVANVGLAALTGRGGLALELGGLAGGIGRRPVEEFRYAPSEQAPVSDLPGAGADVLGTGTALDETGDSFAAGPTADLGPAPVASDEGGGDLGTTAQAALAVAEEKVPAAVLLLGALAALATVAALDRRRLALLSDAGMLR
jgi:hypothetical protein